MLSFCLFHHGEIKTQRGQVTCLEMHSWLLFSLHLEYSSYSEALDKSLKCLDLHFPARISDLQKVSVLRNVQNPFLIQFDVYIDTLRFTFLIIFCLADAKIGLHGLKK